MNFILDSNSPCQDLSHDTSHVMLTGVHHFIHFGTLKYRFA